MKEKLCNKSYLKSICLEPKDEFLPDVTLTRRQEINFTQFLPTRPHLVYYPEIYRIGNNSKKSESQIFLLARSRLSGR